MEPALAERDVDRADAAVEVVVDAVVEETAIGAMGVSAAEQTHLPKLKRNCAKRKVRAHFQDMVTMRNRSVRS